jgi:branched-subunit amino acid ABC-type transport system permease component
MLGFTFDSSLLAPSIANGVAQAGLYGLLAISLVLTYRVSRTVAFVHGGFAMLGAMCYGWLTYLPGFVGLHPDLPRPLGLAIVIAGGGILGAIYGAIVTGKRMANWPKMTLTVFSLGILLLITGLISVIFVLSFGVAGHPPSPFGKGTVHVFDVYISVHQVVTIGIIAVLGAVLALILTRTRGGIYLRAIADDVESSRWVGVPLHTVGTAVYAASGAMSALAGALIAPILGPNLLDVYFVFLRALSAAVIGGFTSFGLALAGAVFFGVADTSLRTGLFGDSTPGQQEMMTMAVVLLAVITFTRYRKNMIELVDAEGM